MYFSVEEADVEDEAGNIIKEVYVQPAAPLEFHASYRLASEDPAMQPKMIRTAGYVPRCGLKSTSQCTGLLPVPADHPPVWQQKLLVEVS